MSSLYCNCFYLNKLNFEENRMHINNSRNCSSNSFNSIINGRRDSDLEDSEDDSWAARLTSTSSGNHLLMNCATVNEDVMPKKGCYNRI
ncbi:hypothetical protein L1987_50660 [Smallanthus sonchifolius]|uniref:Uncharacterized protein n=1 Tax=Smallanthus sonchifolius TaxID=185202 RepID=A0ACB9EN27_9ASTR|nr:hypothetical protein L1987_50660 [Smallanthus sonchifolius]